VYVEVCLCTPELLIFCSVLTLSIAPFLSARILLWLEHFLGADCGTLFSYSDEQDVHLMAQFCPICGVIMPFR
jgi:hypothetical protein